MYKIINDYDLPFDQTSLSLIDIHSKGVDKAWMVKKAAMMTETISKIRPDPNFSYIHLIAMGASDYYGSNRNGDYFNETSKLHTAPDPAPGCDAEIMLGGGLKQYYHTFKSNANVYREHANKDVTKRRGTVEDNAYNDIMHRVELVVKVDNNICHDALEKISKQEQVFYSMACFLDPTYPILTKDGYKPIESVMVGDLVLTHEGRWKKVTALHRRPYTGEACTISMNGLPIPMALTADHPLWAKVFKEGLNKSQIQHESTRYFKSPVEFDATPEGWTHVSHLKVGDRLFYQPTCRFDGYGAIDSEDLARIMGYYLAEGSLSYNEDTPCTVQLTCNTQDSLLRDVPKIIDKVFPGVTCAIVPHALSATCMTVRIHNTSLATFLFKMVGNNAKHKTICPEIFNAAPLIKLAFLGAWLDGDGFIDNKGVHWSTCNQSLALQGRDLLATLDIPA